VATSGDDQGWQWWLEHLLVPVVLTIVTIAGAIVATEIQGRHDRQKELELKTELVARMSSTATEAVFQSQAIADRSVTRGAAKPSEAFQAAYDGNLRQWKVASAEIDAALNAYFGADPSACWEAYGDVVSNYLRLNADPGRNRTAAVEALEAFAPQAHRGAFRCPLTALDLSTTNWEVLREGLDTTHRTFDEIPGILRREFLSTYAVLGDAVLRMGKPLTSSVVSLDANGF